MAEMYSCKVIEKNGALVEKEIEAESITEARAMIMQTGAKPIAIKLANKEKSKKSLANIEITQRKVKSNDLSLFCRQMYTMLHAGMPLIRALGVMSDQLEHPTLKKACVEMMTGVQKGSMFSDVMKKQKKVFPSLLISMVESGEMTGSQDDVLAKMAIHYKKEDAIEKKIKGAMVYPKILIFLVIAVVVIMLTKVFPKFIGLFESSGVELPWPTKFVISLSNSLVNSWYIYIGVIVVAVVAFKLMLKSNQGRHAWDKFLLHVPVVKVQLAKIATSRFTRTLSTLLTSGLPLIASLEMAGRVTGNTVVEEGINEITEDIKKGSKLSSLISRIKVFPPMLVSMIAIGEESGSLESMLERTSDFYDDELESSLQKMVSLIEPVMIIVMGVVIGFIVVSMMWPMMSMFKTIK